MAHKEFRPFDELVTYEVALSVLFDCIKPIDRFEIVSIDKAVDRVLFEDACAKIDMPPFTRSAMDGYALISADTIGVSPENPKKFKVIGRLNAGEAATDILVSNNTCVEVATGAELPSGADAVVRIEDTSQINDEEVLIFVQVKPMTNVSLRGYDKHRGDLLFSSGEVLNAGKIGVLAASGYDKVKVYERPKVAILPTGDEIIEPGRELTRGSIYDSNSYILLALVAKAGCQPIRFPPVKDSFQALCSLINKVSTEDYDIIVMTAGGSVGKRDFAADVLSKLGELKFRGMRTRPGMPTLFAMVNGKPVVSMPGHPVSCYVVANVLLFPVLRRLSGVLKYEPICKRGILKKDVESPKDFHAFIAVSLHGKEVTPVFRYSDMISTIGVANGYVEVPIGIEKIEAGLEVEVKLFEF
ncbi:MAG: molybdopterin molybdotransferase MoeA [Armatimonadetes bacterium]|nr:molybdopterin molybdotransferase MoeA [Armatimonadota bacterium]